MHDIRIKHELWKRGSLTWKLHPTQLLVYKALQALPKAVREVVVLISRRWGKSFLGVIMALEDCLQNPGVQVFIIGPDLKQTTRIITPILNKIILDAPSGLIKQTKSELRWQVGTSTLIIGGFESALESMRGLEAYSIYLEESGLSNPQEYEYTLFSVLFPTLMHSRGRMHHLTTPPKEENHPFIDITMMKAAVNNSLMIYTIEDNPLLTKEEIEAEIESMGGRDSPHCRRELFCEIVKDQERLITPELDEAIHVRPLEVPKHTHFLTSIDFGGTKDPHATLICYWDFLRNKFCVLDEVWLSINTSTDLIIAAAIEKEKLHGVTWEENMPKRVVDAPGQTHVDLRRMGFACVLPSKGKDSVEDGIQALRVALIRNEIEIDPRCHVLINTLKFGMWDKSRKDFQRTVALGHCDMMAALSYAYRHINKRTNPYPWGVGLHKENQYFTPQEQLDNDATLNETFYGEIT